MSSLALVIASRSVQRPSAALRVSLNVLTLSLAAQAGHPFSTVSSRMLWSR
nr:hypothetical protein [Methylomicrobium album]